MHALSIAFLIVALLLAIVFVFISLSFLGLFLSELGLWIFWVPLIFIIISIPFLINYALLHPQTDFFLLLTSTIINLFVFMKLLSPFFKVVRTNKRIKKQFCKVLGDDYLLFVAPETKTSLLKNIRFKFSLCFSGIMFKRFNKEIISLNDLPYRTIDNRTLKMNVLHPKKKGRYPILIYFHGGGWIRGSKDRHLETRILKRLALRGYTIFNVEYRLAPQSTLSTLTKIPHDKPTIRQMVSDIRAAILFMKRHSEEYFGDRENLFLFGRSAGAHLALLTTFSCEEKFFAMENIYCSFDDASVAGVIAFYPITDVTELYSFYQKEVNPILKQAIYRGTAGTFDETKNLFKIFSPISYLSTVAANNIPPIFLAAGKKDRIVDAYQSEELHKDLQERGITSIYIELPWANHGFDIVINGPGGQLVFQYMHQFLQWIVNTKRFQVLLGRLNNLALSRFW